MDGFNTQPFMMLEREISMKIILSHLHTRAPHVVTLDQGACLTSANPHHEIWGFRSVIGPGHQSRALRNA